MNSADNEVYSQIERALESFVEIFLESPYRHRSEHSIHIDLHNSLAKIPGLASKPNLQLKIGENQTWVVSRLQKEWPTSPGRLTPISPEDEKYPIQSNDHELSKLVNEGRRRGLFDLAILPESHPGVSSWREYYSGFQPLPQAVFEVGLDYKTVHFEKDVNKFNCSSNSVIYFVHLYREIANRQNSQIETLWKIWNALPSSEGISYSWASLKQNDEAFAFLGKAVRQ